MQSPTHDCCSTGTRAIDRWEAADGQCVALRPLDRNLAAAFETFLLQLSERSRASRFLAAIRDLPADLVRRLVSADQRQHVAWVVAPCANPGVVIAEARYHAADDEAELALAVTDEWQRRGVGSNLMQQLLRRARASGIRRIWGHVRSDNWAMLGLARRAGFTITMLVEDPGVVLIDRLLDGVDADEGADHTLGDVMPRRSMRRDFEVATTRVARWLREHWLLVLAVVLVPGGSLIAVARGLAAKSGAHTHGWAGKLAQRQGWIRKLLSHRWLARKLGGSHSGSRADTRDPPEAFVDSDPYLGELLTHGAVADRR